MAHMIEDGRCFSVRQTPWHQQGKILDNPPTSAEALVQAGMDWTVSSMPLWAQKELDKPMLATPFCATVRDMDNKILGAVGKGYIPLQNVTAFGIFDPLIREGMLKYETAGVLCGGRRVWILARYTGEDFKINGKDQVSPYLLLCNGHDGRMGVIVQPTPIRVVCWNTLTASLAIGDYTHFIHTGDVEGKTKNTINKVMHSIEAIRQKVPVWSQWDELYLKPAEKHVFFTSMASLVKNPTEDHADELADNLENVIIDAADGAEVIDILQNDFEAMMKVEVDGRGKEEAKRGTLWTTYNTAIEWIDYVAGRRVKDQANYQMFGVGKWLRRGAEILAKGMHDLLTAE